MDKVNMIIKRGDNYCSNMIFNQAIIKYIECIALFKDDSTTHANKIRSKLSSNIAMC